MPRSSSVQSLTNDNYLIEVNDVLEVLDSFWSEEPASSERGTWDRPLWRRVCAEELSRGGRLVRPWTAFGERRHSDPVMSQER
ncbi:hypothetical protein EMIHUDRAFT_207697 [Emiliania huxleyi CCMP1516]|uniref:Uncharacterized protein n=2 Tax=Emiliania huxleyi TaxID=2903 RepID=A0A0D3JDU9_EMIH1|nr:hypothetical protein EMIHUDRAFT_207697 [Emiliania huxleyi CCMP1516]EOD21684.1 hypothetical protein EMIHUDRAFT_207697 [Emiliania huxleyi CCMP1516]|eukprot:XP_005774113.1 hypothetical protein EMIHUDRAFT_207697 [Emiliania huxleyi CCMP1516]